MWIEEIERDISTKNGKTRQKPTERIVFILTGQEERFTESSVSCSVRYVQSVARRRRDRRGESYKVDQSAQFIDVSATVAVVYDCSSSYYTTMLFSSFRAEIYVEDCEKAAAIDVDVLGRSDLVDLHDRARWYIETVWTKTRSRW